MARRPIRYIDPNESETTSAADAAVVQKPNITAPTHADEAKAREDYMQKATDLFKSKSDKYALQRKAEDRLKGTKKYEGMDADQAHKWQRSEKVRGYAYKTAGGDERSANQLIAQDRSTWAKANMSEQDAQAAGLAAKNMQRAKQGLPPLGASYTKSKDTRSGVAYGETDPFEKKWQESQQFRDFQSAKGTMHPTGEINRVDKYGKPLGSAMWKDGEFVGNDDPNLTSKQRADNIRRASEDPSFAREANMAASNAKAKVRAQSAAAVKEMGSRLSMQGLSSKAAEALMGNVKRSEESKATAQELSIEQAARDQIRETREKFVDDQKKILKKGQKTQKQKRQESNDLEREAMIQQTIEEKGLSSIEATKMVDKQISKLGKDPSAQEAYTTFNKLLKGGNVPEGQELQAALNLPGVDGNVKKAKGLMEAAGYDDKTIKKAIEDHQINTLGIDPSLVKESGIIEGMKNAISGITSGEMTGDQAMTMMLDTAEKTPDEFLQSYYKQISDSPNADPMVKMLADGKLAALDKPMTLNEMKAQAVRAQMGQGRTYAEAIAIAEGGGGVGGGYTQTGKVESADDAKDFLSTFTDPNTKFSLEKEMTQIKDPLQRKFIREGAQGFINEKMESGDIGNAMLASSLYEGGLSETAKTSLNKAIITGKQFEDLAVNLRDGVVDGMDASGKRVKVDTGPFKNMLSKLGAMDPTGSAYDEQRRKVEAQLKAIVPNLARGIYGEVGVLTDKDVDLYMSTLPNLGDTEDTNKFLLDSTAKIIQMSAKTIIEGHVADGVNMSGHTKRYQDFVKGMDNATGFTKTRNNLEEAGYSAGQVDKLRDMGLKQQREWVNSNAPANAQPEPVESLGGVPELGATSEKFESGGSPGRIGWDSTGGSSYGAYQIKQTNAPKFIEAMGLTEEFTGLQPGTEEFNAKWQEKATQDPEGFKKTQKDWIGKTHYAPQMTKLKEAKVPDALLRNPAFQDLMWSVSVQHGGNTDVITTGLQNFVTQNPGISLNDESLGNIIDTIMAERGTRFPSSTPQVQAAVKNRFVAEAKDLKKIANQTA